MTCRICNAPVKLYLRKNGYDIYQCIRCGFGQTDVTQQGIADFYNKAYFSGETAHFAQAENAPCPPTHRYWIEQQLARLPQNQPLSVLEIGPGAGGPIATYFQQIRPDIAYTAIEFSDYAAECLRTRNLNVYTGRVVDPDILNPNRGLHDLVFGTEVIEHDLEPHAFVHAVHDMLKPGGIAAFTTGNLQGLQSRWHKADWYYLDPPAHVSFFTPRAVRHVFANEGFDHIRPMRYGFQHMRMKLKTGLPGLLVLTHLLNISTGMSITARRR